jgi:hypothetical protein
MPVTVQFSGNDAQLTAIMNKIVAQQERMEKGFQKTGHAAGGITGHLMGQVKAIGAMAAGYLTLETAIGAVTEAIRHKMEVEKQAKDSAVLYGDALIAATANMANVTGKDLEQIEDQIAAIASLGVSGGKPALAAEFGSALAAAQGDWRKAVNVLGPVAAFRPDSSEVRRELAGATIDVGKITGSEDPWENLGFVKAAGTVVRGREWDKIAKHIVSGMLGMQAYGGTPQENAALAAAITQGSADVEMRRSATAGIQLAQQLNKMFPKKDVPIYAEKRPGVWRQTGVQKGTGAKSTLERLDLLARDPVLLGATLQNLNIETKQEAAVKQIVSRRGVAWDQYQKGVVDTSRPLATMAADLKTEIAERNQRPNIQVANMQRQIDASVSSLGETVGGLKLKRAGLFGWENLQGQLKPTEPSYFERKLTAFAWDVSSSSNQEQYTETVRRRIATMRGHDFLGKDMGRAIPGLTGPTSPEASQMADVLEKNLQATLALADKLDRQIELAEEQLQQGKSPNPAAVQENRNQHGPGRALSFWEAGLGFGVSSR